MTKYICERHGKLEPFDRVSWYKGAGNGRWCRLCLDEALDKLCGKIIEIKEDEDQS